MKSSDRMILVVIGVVGLVAAFWFMVLSPKREEVSTLDSEIATLEASVAEQQQLAATAEAAEQNYESDYRHLVTLGKAVPSDADTSSLFVEVQALADDAGIEFDSIKLANPPAAPAPATPAAETTTDQNEGDAAATTALPVAAATEADAASLPLGAAVGPAGLPVMPYDVKFRGDFFEISDFMANLDSLVEPEGTQVGAIGRLFTVDGFALHVDESKGFPHLIADLHLTTYVTPESQGTTAGATPSAPAPTITGSPAVPTATATP